jgi:hypothetical protein
MSEDREDDSDVSQRERRMTVAVVDEQPSHATVRFLESARIYRLPRASAGYAESFRTLQVAAGTGVAVCVRLTAPHSDLIDRVTTNC